MQQTRKIEVDKNGEIFHVYCINDDHDPHNPDGGIEIDSNEIEFHEKLIYNFDELRYVYKFDKNQNKFVKRSLDIYKKFKPEAIQKDLDEFEEVPVNFIKKFLSVNDIEMPVEEKEQNPKSELELLTERVEQLEQQLKGEIR